MTHLAIILSAMLLQVLQPVTSEPDPVVPAVQVLDTGAHEILPGAIRPTREITLSTSFDTLLGELRVREGQSVTKGEIVAVLDDRVVQAAFRLAEKQAVRTAQIERAEVSLEQATDSLDRVRALWDRGAATESEMIDAELEHKKALADLRYAQEAHAEAQASLDLARARLEEHLVRAPFDALVVRVHAKPGEMIAPGNPLIELVSVDGLCVDLYLPASIAADLQKGDHYALSVQEPAPAVVVARVRYIEPRIDPVSRTMRVVFDLQQPEKSTQLFAGAFAWPATRLPSMYELLTPATASVDPSGSSILD